MKRLRSLSWLMTLGVVSAAAVADERELGAHEHGVAELDVALVGDALDIVLRSPAMNIVGFEHAPRTEAQKQAVADALSALRAADGILDLPGSGRCELRDAQARRVAEAAHGEDDHDHDDPGHEDHGHEDHGHEDHGHEEHGHEEHGHEDHGHDNHGHEEHGHDDPAHGTHSEIEVRYQFRCAQPGEVEAIEVGLFERFPATEEIRVQLLTDTAQQALTLTPARARIDLP
jgi:hypothetical protein